MTLNFDPTTLEATEYQHLQLVMGHRAAAKRMRDFSEDPYQRTRLAKYNCKTCTYLDQRVAGDALTTSYCINCGTSIRNATTDTDQLCEKCAKQLKRCRHCALLID